MSAKQLRDMNSAEALAWGDAEADARMADLAANRSAEGLRAAQDAAKARWKAIGATQSAAAALVAEALRLRRRKAFETAARNLQADE